MMLSTEICINFLYNANHTIFHIPFNASNTLSCFFLVNELIIEYVTYILQHGLPEDFKYRLIIVFCIFFFFGVGHEVLFNFFSGIIFFGISDHLDCYAITINANPALAHV